MKHTLRAAALAVVALASLSAQAPPAAPVKIDGTGGARTAKQTRPPDNRRPRGTAVGLLGWRAGIRSDAFGAIPFSTRLHGSTRQAWHSSKGSARTLITE